MNKDTFVKYEPQGIADNKQQKGTKIKHLSALDIDPELKRGLSSGHVQRTRP